MRVGIYLDLRNPPAWARPWPDLYARNLEIVEEAERLGTHSVWLTEHHFFEDGYLPQPLTFAAAVAARTRRVRIGTAVLLGLLRPAVQLAEEAAIVDLVSGGRLDLGLGTGYRIPEFAAFGIDIRRRWDRLDERVRELRTLWREVVTPPPVQHPVPIWLGYNGPRGARRAGRLGAGMLPGLGPFLDRGIIEEYRQGLAEGGHPSDSARMASLFNAVLADDPDQAWQRIRPHLAYQWDSYNRYMFEGTGRPTPRPIDPDAWRRPGADGKPPRFQVLTPDEAAAALRSLTAGVPIDEIFLWASIAGMPDDLVDRHVQLVCSVLAPAVATQ